MAKKAVLFTTILLLLISSAGYTQSTSLAIKASTLGGGIEVERSFSDSIGGRVGGNYYSTNYSGTEDDIEYTFDVTLKSLSFIFDWHPFKNAFKVSTGALYNGNSINGDAKSASTYEIGDNTFTTAEIGDLEAEITFNTVTPYLGIGWDTSFGKNKAFGFLIELGAVYQGTPEVNFEADGTLKNNPILLAELSKEEDNLQKDLNNYKYYPVVSVGIGYRF